MLTSQVRVCTYDRLNVGRSDSDPGRHTGADSVRDLHALLQTAGVPGPYLLVGFFFGGLLAIMYAGTYPDQVMGLVSLDGSLPTDDQVDQLIPADERAQAIAEQEANQERVEFYRTVDQAKALVAKVPDVPVTYLAARPVELPPTWPVERMQAVIHAKQLSSPRPSPMAGWSRCSPPTTSTWRSPSSSSRRSSGSSTWPSPGNDRRASKATVVGL
jgi:pimeloyl-ACP methyl ester carboxylesterase